MGYTYKGAVAAALSTTNTETLAVWQAHFLEMHNALIAAGWVQTGDTGQLDISAVTPVPVKPNYVGYRMYEINDDMSLAGYGIYMKLEFGTYSETGSTSNGGNHSGGTPSVKATFGMKTDGAGNLLSQSSAPLVSNLTIVHPFSAIQSATNGSTFVRPSSYTYVCKNSDAGFNGFIFYCNGRGFNNNGNGFKYNAASLAFFIQRTLNSSGAVTNEGFTIIQPKGVTDMYRWPDDFFNNLGLNNTLGFSYSSNTIEKSSDLQNRPGGLDGSPISGAIQIVRASVFQVQMSSSYRT